MQVYGGSFTRREPKESGRVNKRGIGIAYLASNLNASNRPHPEIQVDFNKLGSMRHVSIAINFSLIAHIFEMQSPLARVYQPPVPVLGPSHKTR